VSIPADLELTMDVASLAAAMIGAQAGRTQMAVATKIMKMSIDSEASVLQLLQAGQQNAGKLADAAAGLGQNLDITA
jgi:hypothetical protein